MRRAAVLALAAAGALAAAAPAGADSIAYVKDGDVWLATPDGARQVPVTRGGGYAYVSQADDGTMIALTSVGERLRKLSRSGAVLADFPTFVSDGAPQAGPENQFAGPFEPEISPDGRLVAFEWFNRSYDNPSDPNCSRGMSCYALTQRQGVGVTSSDGFTPYGTYGILSGWIGPDWMSSSTLLRSGSGATLTDDAVFTELGPGKADRDLDPWFVDHSGTGPVIDVELSRDRRVAVGIAGLSEETLRVYRPLRDPFTAPDWNHRPFASGNEDVVQACYDLAGGPFESVSLAPDGRHLAYATSAGVSVAALPDLGAGCAPAPSAPRLALPGARFPDWGPADVPAGAGAAGGGSGSGSGGPGTGPVVTAAAPLAVRAPGTARTAALARGLALTVTAPAAGTVRATVTSGGTVVARGSARAPRAGTLKLLARFTAAGRARVRRTRRPLLKVTVTQAARTARATVTLR